MAHAVENVFRVVSRIYARRTETLGIRLRFRRAMKFPSTQWSLLAQAALHG